MKLHERLRELRRERHLTLKQVGARTGLSIPYLSDLERGRCVPPLDTLKKLAGGYGVTVRDILNDVELTPVAVTPQTTPLPPGLQQLAEDPYFGADLTPDWLRTLSRIELRGRRPQTKSDWHEIFLHLRRILI